MIRPTVSNSNGVNFNALPKLKLFTPIYVSNSNGVNFNPKDGFVNVTTSCKFQTPTE